MPKELSAVFVSAYVSIARLEVEQLPSAVPVNPLHFEWVYLTCPFVFFTVLV